MGWGDNIIINVQNVSDTQPIRWRNRVNFQDPQIGLNKLETSIVFLL